MTYAFHISYNKLRKISPQSEAKIMVKCSDFPFENAKILSMGIKPSNIPIFTMVGFYNHGYMLCVIQFYYGYFPVVEYRTLTITPFVTTNL